MSFFYYFVLYDKAVDVYIHTRNDSVQIELLDLEITFESSYLVEMISRAIRFWLYRENIWRDIENTLDWSSMKEEERKP